MITRDKKACFPKITVLYFIRKTEDKMRVVIVKNAEELAAKAAEEALEVIRAKKDAVLGLATGSTPVGMYKKLIEDHKKNGTSYRLVKAVNLDEYIGLSPENDQSYRYFMRKNLFDEIDIDLDNTFIENGLAADEKAECARYDALLRSLPRDLQVLGIGANGHIAFNEPGTSFDEETHAVSLTENTIEMNSRFFKSKDEVPRRAFTMGPKSIMEAKKILILASGASKAYAVFKTIRGEVTEEVPASILQNHPNCVLIADEAAASLL